MSMLEAILGIARKVPSEDVQREFQQILCGGEDIQHAYKLVRDLFIFTDRRLILIDKQGITGRKTQYHTVPYKSIVHFSIETAGHFDLDAELKIWVSGLPQPFKTEFNKAVNIYEIQALLASYVLPTPTGISIPPSLAGAFGGSSSQGSRRSAQAIEPPSQLPPDLPATSSDEQARVLFEMAKQAAKSGNNQQAIDFLTRIIRDYPSTKYAASAKRTVETTTTG